MRFLASEFGMVPRPSGFIAIQPGVEASNILLIFEGRNFVERRYAFRTQVLVRG